METLRLVSSSKKRIGISGVYLITDESDNLYRKVRLAAGAGISALQFRFKGIDQLKKLRVARELKDICKQSGIIYIVNDDPQIALKIDADGVHLGQDDGDIKSARQILGEGKIIGVSTHSVEEALKAEAEGADYIGVGAMFSTSTKKVEHHIGPDSLKAIRSKVSLPIVAIGGITRDNASILINNGADALAVISAVMNASDPAVAAYELSLLFNRKLPYPRGNILSIAGSDSGGGAGVQADIKSAAILGSYASTVITAVTAQNTLGVSGIHALPSEFVAEQLDTVLTDIPVDAVKTGMLYSSEIIAVTADRLSAYNKKIVVVDPVMIAKGGASLIDDAAVTTMTARLFPMTYLLTPNIPEASRLAGIEITNEDSVCRAAEILHLMGAKNILIKGGHLPESMAVDTLYDGKEFYRFESPKILSRNTHGTGCTLSTAITVFLAQGYPIKEAVELGKRFVTEAIRNARNLGKGHGPVNHFIAGLQFMPKYK